MRNCVLSLCLFLLTTCMVFGQRNLNCRVVQAQDTITLHDSLTILPATIVITRSGQDTIAPYDYSFYRNRIFFTPKWPQNSNPVLLTICYRTLPFNLENRVVGLDSTRIKPTIKGDLWQFRPNDEKSNALLPVNRDLSYSGGLTRGIAVGNNQDLVVNSNFNLQMNGKLSRDIEITAALSDNTIPIQPDGNTAQLNQFDRIFIQLKRKNAQLNAGDFDLQRPNSYFVTYNKRVQGLGAQYNTKISDHVTLNSRATAAVSRGKFNRQFITGMEGNQGPYRLRGNGGEQFIIVVSATERIFIDGILMKRGFDNDYVIDYNQGTITFTPKRLITKDSRIIAEFDYSDQHFIRTLYTAATEYRNERMKLYLNIYGEQDGRSSGTQQSLSVADRKALAEGGDQSLIVSAGIDTVEFSSDRILYKALADQSGKTYFEASSNPDSARYFVRFMEVNKGEGDYTVRISSANGRVFEYVGSGNGNFKVGSGLVSPKLFQVFAVGAEYALFNKKNTQLKTELVMSNNDQNRLSALDKSDDTGFAAMLQYKHHLKLSSLWKMDLDAGLESTGKHFKVLNPYRQVEFTRDWNTATNILPGAENLLRTKIGLVRDSLASVQYEFNRFQRLNQYLGSKQIFDFLLEKKGWHFAGTGNLLNSESPDEKTTFLRPKADLRKTLKNPGNAIGLYFEKESNKRVAADTLSRNGFDFEITKAYLNLENRKGLSLAAFAQQRIDKLPLREQFARSSTAHELNLTGNYSDKKGIQLNGNFAYRQLQINNSSLIALKSQDNYLGRINFTLAKFKNAVVLNTSYELGSGQEQRLEYYYQRVQPGFGSLTWRDYNKDDIIQQDEVFPAIFRDSANIVRFVLPTNQFVQTHNTGFSQVLNLSPATYWSRSSGLKKALTHFSTESYFQIQNKVRFGVGQAAWNPFSRIGITDTALVAATNANRHTIYFNRSHPIYEISMGVNDNTARSLLTSGFDIRGLTENFIRARWNIGRKATIRVSLMHSIKKSESEFLVLRNYTIHSRVFEPEGSILLNRNFRMHLVYSYSNSVDSASSLKKARIHNLSDEVTYNYSSRTSIRAKMSLVQIQYEGLANTPAQYVMLNGLQSGQNFLWNIQLNQALNKTLQLEFRYDGRKTGTNGRVIHTGNMVVRALF